MDVKVTVIARVLALLIAFLNQWLSKNGISSIPTDEAFLITFAVALYTTWKDNPFTKESKQANKLMKELKAQKKYEKEVNKYGEKE